MTFDDDLEPKTLAVEFKKNGEITQRYVLREVDEAANRSYFRELVKNTFQDKSGKLVTDTTTAKDVLLSCCLYESADGKLPLDAEGKNTDRSKLVSLDRVLALRPGVADKLKTWLDDNSDMGERDSVEKLEKQIANLQERLSVLKKDDRTEAVDPAKNAPSAGGTTSI